MNLPYALPKWTDGFYKVPRPAGLPVFSAPLPNTSSPYLLKQKFQQFRTNWSALALNTKHPNYNTYVLVAEGEHADVGGAIIEWERTYAQVPSTYSEFETFGYQFIGTFYETVSPPGTWPTTYTRNPYSPPGGVQSRIQYDFYLVGDTATPTSDNYGAGVGDGNSSSGGAGSVASPYDVIGSIPFIMQMQYVAQAYLSGAWYGGISWLATWLSDTTYPTSTTYLKMVDDALVNSWGATTTVQHTNRISSSQTIITPQSTDTPSTPTPNSVYGGQIPAETSKISRWMGNIWLRRTRYVLAQ